jgi:hypothetical protein
MATSKVEVMPMQHAENRQVIVHIRVEGDTIQVDPEVFQIRKQSDQEVKWVRTDGDGDFLIEFGQDSPFYEFQFSKDAPVSGLARRTILADENRVYKYSIRVGNKVLDPGGIIRK